MFGKGHIVKNPSGKTESEKYNKGNVNRGSLAFIVLDKHPLREEISKSVKLATHHIITVKATFSLSQVRRNLLIHKAYDVNHPKNLLTLPTEKKICCHYAIPRHTSGHTGKNIVGDYGFDEKKGGQELKRLYEEQLKEVSEEVSEEDATFDDDMEGVDSLLAYHKICRYRLSIKMKAEKLNCKSKPEKVVDEIDKLSCKLLYDISKFKLNLFNNGKFYHKDSPVGCKQNPSKECVKIITDNGKDVLLKREHGFPDIELKKIYLAGDILKRVYDLKDEFGFECNAPEKYQKG